LACVCALAITSPVIEPPSFAAEAAAPNPKEPLVNIKLVLLSLVLLGFGALSTEAMLEAGYLGIFLYQFGSSAGWQVLADLVIACSLIMLWMIGDARRSGRSIWPYLLLTLSAGSFGPLLYLWVGALRSSSEERRALA
jgi:hypothetical protein